MGQEKMPKVVYKYRVWDDVFHKRILENNEVYYSAPSDFEDKFDCNPPIKYPHGYELFMYFLRYSKAQNLNNNIFWHLRNACYLYRSSPMIIPDEFEKIEKKNKDEFNKRFGVLSLTTQCNNAAMWYKYSDNHKGFCVGFDTNRLFLSIKGGCGPVFYHETLPAIDFAKDSINDRIIKTIYNKEKKWIFEHEYRFHTMWDENEDIDRNIRLQRNTIVEVILGKNMSKEYREEIKTVVKLKHPKAQIIES